MAAPITIIVGAGNGLGLALARCFGREGHEVVLLARDWRRLEKAAAELAGEGIAAESLPVEAGEFAGLGGSLGRLVEQEGPPACLVYNAAAMEPRAPLDLDPEQLMRELRVDVGGALAAARAVAPAMARARRGAILFTGGGFALEPSPAMTALGVGKAAIRNLAFSLHADLKPRGIHVATVTICGLIAKEPPFTAPLIAEAFWKLYREPAGSWSREVVYK